MLAKEQAESAAYRASDPNWTRPSIGAGRLGNECLRSIAFEYHKVPRDPERMPDGRLLRIFERGHRGEAAMAARLRLAGFELATERPDGKQFRYDVAPYADGKGRVKGMIDGIVTTAPYLSGMAVPALWENKELGAKGWGKLSKLGVRGYGGDYFAQVQMGMAYLQLTDNPALFTATNADTQQIYAERVPFDREAAQAASDKAARIAGTAGPLDMPRVAKSQTDFRCKFCDWQDRCWSQPDVPVGTGPWAWGSHA